MGPPGATEGASALTADGETAAANPDLPRRLAEGAPLTADDMATWYSQGPQGYIDYPTL